MTHPRLEHTGRIAVLTLDDPSTLNALGESFWPALAARCAEIAGMQPTPGAMVLTGTGRAFSAGGQLSPDLQRRMSGLGCEAAVAAYMIRTVSPAVEALRALSIPVISAVNGIAAGAGVSLALCADVVLMARSASFTLPFMPRLGLLPDCGLTWTLPRAVGRARAGAMMLLGSKVTAEQAERWGLAWECVDDEQLLPRALELAERLAAAPRHAIDEVRQALDASERRSFSEQLLYEAERQSLLSARPEFTEGLSAFLDKRSPEFHP